MRDDRANKQSPEKHAESSVVDPRHFVRIQMRILGSVPLSNGSGCGSGRPKKIRIRMRIRIHNTDRKKNLAKLSQGLQKKRQNRKCAGSNCLCA
jgi:hypothetical protein